MSHAVVAPPCFPTVSSGVPWRDKGSSEAVRGAAYTLPLLILSISDLFHQGKSSVSLKESSLFGISLSDHVKAESSSSALRFKVVDFGLAKLTEVGSASL
ncbi:hypothetical protein ACSBR1_007664 [Camellia fascicularis]